MFCFREKLCTYCCYLFSAQMIHKVKHSLLTIKIVRRTDFEFFFLLEIIDFKKKYSFFFFFQLLSWFLQKIRSSTAVKNKKISIPLCIRVARNDAQDFCVQFCVQFLVCQKMQIHTVTVFIKLVKVACKNVVTCIY